jgi:hypothetical protein
VLLFDMFEASKHSGCKRRACSNHNDTLESIVMATQTLPPRPSYVLLTLAQREARLAVKEQLRARGIKVQHMRASEISATAKLYFEANARALFEEAWRKCQRCPDLMRFYEKEQKDRQRKTVHILSQTVITCPASGEVSQ